MPLGAYCYLRVVGKGSYGEVTLVKHRRDGRQYVIKKLNLRNASSRERRAAEQEAQLLSQLKHPNIVTYKESWEGGDGLLYIVMGFCEGGDLYRKLKERKGQLLPESQVVEWFVQIAMALQYLHEKHILHRDLKTQNVFLTRTNIIKVGDLGIARVLENHCDMASTLIGTPYYMSPELFSNKPYNYKSDVWALGCCVYEMATLKHAFNARDMNSLVYRIIEGKLPPMPKDYSPELAELIRTMLSKRPEERPSVRSILRQPYIKRQIALFLEATKAKTCKNNIRNSDCKSKPVAAMELRSSEADHEVPHLQAPSPKDSRTGAMGEDARVSHGKPLVVGSLKSPTDVRGHSSKPCMSDTAHALATVSGVDIDISPAERRDSLSGGLVQENQQVRLDAQCGLSQVMEERPKDSATSPPQSENLVSSSSHDDGTGGGPEPVTKPLQPLQRDPKPEDMVHEAAPGLLPSQPSIGTKAIGSTQKDAKSQSRAVSRSMDSSRSNETSSSKDRPLSARERRRLKQSQEEVPSSGPSVRRALSAVGPETPQEEGWSAPARRLSSDCSVPKVRYSPEGKSMKSIHSLSEDELSSSTSSTDKSDGDSREGKGHTNEMSDLVQLMTQTLKLDSKDSCEDLTVPNPVSEFRLHRKYRDTLILHGKVPEEAGQLHFKELPPAVMPGSEKIRRIVEVLRADVIQGLGVQLLEQVYDLLEEEDDLQREVRLREHMGEKYIAYGMKARQLKFFEENVNF
ncbi:serine/threonine-protein kinase Nek4 isoform X4 [Ochotona curzoniae]|uniref:serine/threonine-protein kinase Nek4 isoform X4 n=1 Tax=Ochotona curzoniae TaxID=130825 RepID=UPI001B34F4CD|nr:serine/threonine-protein kinase Nek4 isoform X4 [Ochotona curzoniae]